MSPPRYARSRWWAPAIVSASSVAGAHPFCHLVFHCGCSALALTAHCNIHAPSPPHCPWCAQPLWFVLAALLALVAGGAAMALVRRRSTAILPSVSAGLVGAVAGASLGAMITILAR
ncbi:MAG TPA: hypothetical protein VN947_14035 [Polyangia bacterium]|nr:hypothetical protein [Polyangia bacterium]